MKKIYSVSMPVCAHVSVFVEAENEEQAEELATFNASLSDAEAIDWANDPCDVMEVKESDIPGAKIYIAKNKSRIVKR